MQIHTKHIPGKSHTHTVHTNKNNRDKHTKKKKNPACRAHE